MSQPHTIVFICSGGGRKMPTEIAKHILVCFVVEREKMNLVNRHRVHWVWVCPLHFIRGPLEGLKISITICTIWLSQSGHNCMLWRVCGVCMSHHLSEQCAHYNAHAHPLVYYNIKGASRPHPPVLIQLSCHIVGTALRLVVLNAKLVCMHVRSSESVLFLPYH